MNINLSTKNFKEDIVKLVNGCGLPAVNILYVLKDITCEVEQIFNNSLAEEEATNGNSN